MDVAQKHEQGSFLALNVAGRFREERVRSQWSKQMLHKMDTTWRSVMAMETLMLILGSCESRETQ